MRKQYSVEFTSGDTLPFVRVYDGSGKVVSLWLARGNEKPIPAPFSCPEDSNSLEPKFDSVEAAMKYGLQGLFENLKAAELWIISRDITRHVAGSAETYTQ